MSKEFAIGATVRVVALPPYIKTADPMPMLRPPDIIRIGEEGTVIDRRPGGYWGVRFTKGTFLIDSQYIEAINATAPDTPSSEHLEPSNTTPIEAKTEELEQERRDD